MAAKNIILMTFIAMISACSTMPSVDLGATESEIEKKLSHGLCEYDCEVLGSPAVWSGPARNSRYSVGLEMHYDQGAQWRFDYASSDNLGSRVYVVAGETRYPATTSFVQGAWGLDTTYMASIPRAFIEGALSGSRQITIEGESGSATVTMTPQLASVFLRKADEIVLKWQTQRSTILDGLLSKAGAATTVKRDDFKKLTWINGMRRALPAQDIEYNLYARLEDSGGRSYWLRVSSKRSYISGWAFYEYAVDSDGKRLSLENFSDVGSGGTTYESLHIPMSIRYLEEKRDGGLDIKIYGKRDSAEIRVGSWLIESFLLELEAQEERLGLANK